jgi:hypothetical protein
MTQVGERQLAGDGCRRQRGLRERRMEHEHGHRGATKHAQGCAGHRETGTSRHSPCGHRQEHDVVGPLGVADELIVGVADEHVVVDAAGRVEPRCQASHVRGLVGVGVDVRPTDLEQSHPQAERRGQLHDRGHDGFAVLAPIECHGYHVGCGTVVGARSDHQDRHFGVADQVGADAAEQQLPERSAAVATDAPERARPSQHLGDQTALDVVVVDRQHPLADAHTLLCRERPQRGSRGALVAARGDRDELDSGPDTCGE